MKNKVKKILILFAIVLITSIVGIKVYAENVNIYVPETYEVKSEDIPNSTYVIGTHMFTRQKNDEIGYDGQLSTQLIMLASKTINSNNLNDMIIYYKNPRGKWVNALTENVVEAPETFAISKKDLQKYILTPVLQFTTYVYSNGNQEEDFYINVKNYKDYYSESDKYTYNISGIEIYRTFVGGDGIKRYSEEKTINPDSFFKSIRNIGFKASYVARAYVLDANGEKIYSDYSNEIDINTYDKNRLSLDEFKAITNETTLGELKSKYNLEPSIANLSNDTTAYLYDFKGHVNNSIGITPNVQFEFGSDLDSANLKAKVYRNLVTADEIDHSKYDDGDGKIEISDFESIELTTSDALMELLGEPYMIKAIYDREGSSEYPTIELTYIIKDSDQIINFNFGNGVKGKMLTKDFSNVYAEKLLNENFISSDGKYELEFFNFANNNNEIRINMTHKSGRIIQIEGEVRATTLDKLQTDYIFKGYHYSGGPVIIGRLRETGNNIFTMDVYVFKDTESQEEISEAYNDLTIGYNKLEFTLKSE